jgi:asparagine synthase (glutamine-hydrolysing)
MGLLWPSLSTTQSYLIFHSTFQPSVIRKLLPGALHTETVRVFAEFLDTTYGKRMSRMLLCDTMTLLAESFMMKADKGSMANSIEERTPYLDRGLVEFALQIPDSLKVRLGEEKVLLRRVGRAILPKSTARRRKRGYGTPFTGWVKREIGDYLANVISDDESLKNLLNRSMIARICGSRMSRPKEFWALGSLALWRAAYVDYLAD